MIKKAVIMLMLILLTGCYKPITGTVVDADTNAPIEGAVVMVEWTMTHGIGNYSTESYKVAETMTDKNGTFTLPGCYRPFVNGPNVTIYKKGFVAWSSIWIFPSNENRTDFRWGNYVFRIERFKREYSYEEHTSFIRNAIHSGLALGKKDRFKDAIEWEETEALKERQQKRAK